MRRKRSSVFLFVLAVCLCLSAAAPFLSSCSRQEEGDPDGENGEAQPLQTPFTVTVGRQDFSVTHCNGTPKGEEIVVYTHDYRVDGKPALKVKNPDGDRMMICISLEHSSAKDQFSIYETGNEAGAEYPIAFNGFTLSIPVSQVQDLRIRPGQLVPVKDESGQLGTMERLDLGTFYHAGEYLSAFVRRISLQDPETELTGDRIYFFSKRYSASAHALPEGSFVVTLEEKNSSRYTVADAFEAAESAEGKPQMIFTGEYNRVFAKEYLTPGTDLNVNNLDSVSCYSDVPAMVFGGEICTVEGHLNVDSITGDGVYLSDVSGGTLLSAPSSLDRRDVVVINDIVTYVGEENARVLLPTAGGVVVTFAGAKKELADNLHLGDEVESVLVDTAQMDGKFVRIGTRNYAVDLVNKIRAPEGVTAVYTGDFGKTTGTNQYGAEIAVENGVVKAIEFGVGDMEIPENGFVFSIHKDSEYYSSILSEIKEGDSGAAFLSGSNYGLTPLKVTGLDTVRSENALIVYRKGFRTGTNVYGYEILVDQDGYAIGDSHAGNSDIPKGGFVLSGHGTNGEALENAYLYGAKVLFDEKTMEVYIISSPETQAVSASHEVDELAKELETAQNQLRDIDYETVGPEIEELKKTIGQARADILTDKCESALAAVENVRNNLERIRYEMIETHAAENRSVWYRSSEKSDDEVRATVEKMKRLNVNALYLETWYNGRFTGFSDNPLIPHTTAANGDYDVLEGFVRICHENGIRVHVWVENFFIGTVEAQEAANRELADHFAGRWLTDCKGNDTFYYGESQTHFIFMNPFDEEVRSFLLDFYREIVTKYDVDGIHLDYIRFPELNFGTNDFGYNEDIVSAWQAQEKTDTDPRTLKSGAQFDSWVKFRQEIINSFVGSVRSMLNRNAPMTWLSAAVYPGLPTIKNQIFQDCLNWVENGYMDELFSMSYGSDNAYVSGNAAMFAEEVGDSCFYSTGISAFGDTFGRDFALQMTEVRQVGADGVAIFSLGNLSPANYEPQVVKGAFRSPSVQVTLLNETVSAQLRGLIRKCGTVFVRYGGMTEEDAERIKGLLGTIADDADAFDREIASVGQMISYCEKEISRLEKARSELENCFSDGQKAAFALRDLDDLIGWLRVSEARLKKRS